ncbi:MAG TPA: hypothetical protein PLP29_06515 [Candidatus Ozemobacteraceae bacterium]|nr:hypothetical protein [Candidatus Ozemobacteraceae bacterium]
MFRHLVTRFLLPAAVALVLSTSGAVFAQSVSGMEFDLAGDEAARAAAAAQDSENLGEFKISLDSQLLTPRVEQTVAERFQLPEAHSQPFTGEFVLRSSSLGGEDTSVFDPSARRLRETRKTDSRTFDTTLTLTAGYVHDHDGEPSRLTAGRRVGRLSLYGEFEKDTVSKMTFKTAPEANRVDPVPLSNLAARAVRGSSAAQDPAARLTRPLDAHAATEDVSALALKNYYLEAIYSFLPAVQGKVSYKRSEIETLNPNENVQVEGIVEAGQDVIIKAGYRNETTVSDQKDRRPASDKKVWTEFILKF